VRLGPCLGGALLVWILANVLPAPLVSSASAQGGGQAVIPEGSEEAIQRLFLPHRLGDELSPGWRWMSLQINPTEVVCRVDGPGGENATLRLEVEAFRSDRMRLAVISREAAPGPASEALAPLEAAVASAASGPDGAEVSLEMEGPGRSGSAGVGALINPRAWLGDGIVLLALWLLGLLLVLGRQLQALSWRYAAALFGLLALGLLLRLGLSEEMAMGAWPFSRLNFLVLLLWDGPGLSAISEHLDASPSLWDIPHDLTLAISVITPLALFVHARQLLERDRAALLLAAIVVLLPTHIRFSRSEVVFIASMAMSSTAFAFLHVALKDSSRAWRLIALALLPIPLVITFFARPLNLLFLPLLLITAFWLSRERTTIWRQLSAGGLVLGLALLALFFSFIPEFGHGARESASPQLLLDIVFAFTSVKYNTLINPWITPPILLALALFGSWMVWRRDRPRALFLLAWFALFFAGHCVVLPSVTAMQARYHLHLVVPFAMLAALGLDELFVAFERGTLPPWIARRLGSPRRRHLALALLLASIALSPLLHRDFITDIAFNDMREYAFVRDLRPHIPEGCTVLEYTGPRTDVDHDVRLERRGAELRGGWRHRRYDVRAIGIEPGPGEPLRPEVEALLRDPPECLMYYEGLFCWARKGPEDPIAPACEQLRHRADLEPIVQEPITASRPYDGAMAMGLREQDHVTFGLYRLHVRAAAAPPQGRRTTR